MADSALPVPVSGGTAFALSSFHACRVEESVRKAEVR